MIWWAIRLGKPPCGNLSTRRGYWQITQILLLYALRIARPFAVVLPLCVLLLGRAPNRTAGGRGLPGAMIVLSLQLAGYFLTYLLSPWDLHWHLASSADRLLLQLCPLGLLVLFLWLATPEEIFGQSFSPAAALHGEKSLGTAEGGCATPGVVKRPRVTSRRKSGPRAPIRADRRHRRLRGGPRPR